ncbi:MAG: hypothetical protein ABR972_02345 [Acidimicrobiales bacterium]|jgi:hypothetical protein
MDCLAVRVLLAGDLSSASGERVAGATGWVRCGECSSVKQIGAHARRKCQTR